MTDARPIAARRERRPKHSRSSEEEQNSLGRTSLLSCSASSRWARNPQRLTRAPHPRWDARFAHRPFSPSFSPLARNAFKPMGFEGPLSCTFMVGLPGKGTCPRTYLGHDDRIRTERCSVNADHDREPSC